VEAARKQIQAFAGQPARVGRAESHNPVPATRARAPTKFSIVASNCRLSLYPVTWFIPWL
jgi:hypothetical protein